MLKKIKKFLRADAGQIPDAGADTDLQSAAAALLVEAASIDGQFDPDERRTIARVLSEKFDMDHVEVQELIEEGIQATDHAVEIYGFIRRVNDGFGHDERVALIEMLWEVVYADGVLDDYEANLIRRLTGLLHVTDRESGEARKRVLERLDKNGEDA